MLARTQTEKLINEWTLTTFYYVNNNNNNNNNNNIHKVFNMIP